MLNTINSGGEIGNGSPTSVSMPKTVNFKEFMKSKKVRKTFLSKFFAIGDDYSATVYAEFINEIMNNPQKYHLIREEQTWTKEGELIRMVDYIETETIEGPEQKQAKKKIKIDPIQEPSSTSKQKEEPKESTKVIVEGSSHYKEVDIGVVSDE